MPPIVNDAALDTLFRSVRDQHAWLDRPVSETILRAVWELARHAPMSGFAPPARIVFIQSQTARAHLEPAVPIEARSRVMTAPVAVILGRALARERAMDALHEAGIKAAGLMLAARALGLDCSPVWHFDGQLLDAAFFPDGQFAANFLCAIGYGDETQERATIERVCDADDICRIA
ncbi:MAG TPA: hypothetical protein VHW90_14255 [Stellaceae bacterium]|jgi:3-hydroxypropanoate dehydrogenase|nr:hypothetical protein [Stellaceae bacterium]